MIKESTYEMIPEQITSHLTIIACEAADSKFLTFFYWLLDGQTHKDSSNFLFSHHLETWGPCQPFGFGHFYQFVTLDSLTTPSHLSVH